MKIIARTIGARAVASNTDRVLLAMPIPKGGVLESVQGELHILASTEDQPIAKIMAYGITGEMVPIVAADGPTEYQDIWDNVVIKALDPTQSAGTIRLDFDWDTAVTSPAVEPGEIDTDRLLGMTQGQKTFLGPTLEWISWAKNRQGGYTAGTPDDWQPSDFKTFRSRKRLVADGPSAALIAVSSPSLDDLREEAAHLSPATESQWYMMQNMRDTMNEVGKFQAGLSELTAETPGLDASALIEELIAPSMLDENTTIYLATGWIAFASATWVIDFPNSSIPNTLDGR